MPEKDKDKPNGAWAVGGGVILGVGVGFFLLQFSALYFVGSILVGLGVGLVIAPIIEKKK